MDIKKSIPYLDRTIFACLCLLIFCLPFAKAGVETFTWLSIFLFVLKRAFGYRSEKFWHLLPDTWLNAALAIFLVANIISVAFSVDFALSLRALFGKILKFIVIFFMVAETVNSEKRIRFILTVMIASVSLILTDVGWQYFTGTDFLRGYVGFSIIEPTYLMRGPFGNSADFAGWLIVIIPLFVGLLLTRNSFNKYLKIILVFLTALSLLCILITLSRGAWLGIMLALLLIGFYLFKHSKKKTKVLCLCSILCIVALFFSLPKQVKYKGKNFIRNNIRQSRAVIVRIKSIPQTNKGSNFERIRLWTEALNITKDHPLFGCGLNTYSIVARNYKIKGGGGIYPHNSFLQMSAETGITGLIAFLFLLYMFFRVVLSHLNKARNPLVLGLTSGILAFLVQSFFDTNLYALQMVVLFWFTLGLIVAVLKMEQSKAMVIR